MTQNQNEETKMHIPQEFAEKPVTHNGPILAILVIILVVLLGGLYLWGNVLRDEQPQSPNIINNEPETPRSEVDVQILNTMSPSDEIDAIEADLDNTELDSLTAELVAIDAELDLLFAQ